MTNENYNLNEDDIQGIGETQEEIGVIRRNLPRVNAAIQRKVKRSYSSPEQLALNENIAKLPAQTQSEIRANNITLRDSVMYVRREAVGGGQQDTFLGDNPEKTAGVTNFNKAGKLDDNQNLVISRLELDYDNSTTVTSPKAATYDPVSPSTTDPAFLNAEIIMTVDDKPVLKIPANKFNRMPKDGDGVANGYNLKKMLVIPYTARVQFVVKFPEGSTLDATGGKKHFYQVTAIGVETVLKTVANA